MKTKTKKNMSYPKEELLLVLNNLEKSIIEVDEIIKAAEQFKDIVSRLKFAMVDNGSETLKREAFITSIEALGIPAKQAKVRALMKTKGIITNLKEFYQLADDCGYVILDRIGGYNQKFIVPKEQI